MYFLVSFRSEKRNCTNREVSNRSNNYVYYHCISYGNWQPHKRFMCGNAWNVKVKFPNHHSKRWCRCCISEIESSRVNVKHNLCEMQECSCGALRFLRVIVHFECSYIHFMKDQQTTLYLLQQDTAMLNRLSYVIWWYHHGYVFFLILQRHRRCAWRACFHCSGFRDLPP